MELFAGYVPFMGRNGTKRTMVWIQPPGTPSVGHLLLDAYHATGDEYYYEAARKVANTLIWGQLECGGWNYVFDFAGENSLKSWYDTVGKNGWRLEEFQHYYGNATYDDAGTMELPSSCFVCMWRKMMLLSARLWKNH